jgi:hypothetical protein
MYHFAIKKSIIEDKSDKKIKTEIHSVIFGLLQKLTGSIVSFTSGYRNKNHYSWFWNQRPTVCVIVPAGSFVVFIR